MNSFKIPPFKHPDPDQSKMQENEMSCDQCSFKCESDLVLKHHIAKKLMKPYVSPPSYSDIDPNENYSECSYCNLKFVGNHAYGKHLIDDHKFFFTSVATARLSFLIVQTSTTYISAYPTLGSNMKNHYATQLS